MFLTPCHVCRKGTDKPMTCRDCIEDICEDCRVNESEQEHDYADGTATYWNCQCKPCHEELGA